jgi:hypothetical protein
MTPQAAQEQLAKVAAFIGTLPDGVEISNISDMTITLLSPKAFDWSGGTRKRFQSSIHWEKWVNGIRVQTFEPESEKIEVIP